MLCLLRPMHSGDLGVFHIIARCRSARQALCIFLLLPSYLSPAFGTGHYSTNGRLTLSCGMHMAICTSSSTIATIRVSMLKESSTMTVRKTFIYFWYYQTRDLGVTTPRTDDCRATLFSICPRGNSAPLNSACRTISPDSRIHYVASGFLQAWLVSRCLTACAARDRGRA